VVAVDALEHSVQAKGQAGGGWRERARHGWRWLHLHQTLLWWLHSVWALAFGVGVMWLGSRNFTYLRVAILHVSFIWATSLVFPWIARAAWLPPVWRPRVQLVINYFNKNFYQQLLFFILPIYALSTTLDSLNVVFLIALGACAILSTLDLIYDRHLAARRLWTAAFFGCTLFGAVAAALPILWSVPPVAALWVAAAAAGVGIASLLVTERRLEWQRTWFAGGVMIVALALLVEYGRPAIPPAPLRLASAAFGTDIDRRSLRLAAELEALPADYRGNVYVLTAIYAPLGLHDRVRHVWYQDDVPIWASRWYDVNGGRAEGYRLWTGRDNLSVPAGARLHVDVETEGGQLIGRARIRAERR
jgi:hypothetical protein